MVALCRLVAIAVGVTVMGYGQGGSGAITGRVTDGTGAAVPGAKVVVRNVNTAEQRVVETAAEGDYTVPNLIPGIYDLEVEGAGFKKHVETGLELQVDQVARVDVGLEVGSVADSVQVTAETPVLNTESASKGEVITGTEIVEMPLDGRDFADLAFLVPGVQRRAQGGQSSQFSVNGARGDANNFVIDGFNNVNPRGSAAQARPNVDAMQEFKMQTSGYSAEYGRQAGGIMNMVLKTGGNRYHGAVFYFGRNDRLDARNFFDAARPQLRRHQGGGTVHGPVRLPRVYEGKDKTFFLFSWETYRQTLGTNRLGIVPTAEQRAGDYAEFVDPATRQVIRLVDPLAAGTCVEGMRGGCFAGNRIPVSRLHAVSAKLMAVYPQANRAGQVNNYATRAADTDSWDSVVGKVDHRVTEKDTVSGRLLMRRNRNTEPFAGSDLALFPDRVRQPQTLGGFTYTRMFSGALLNEVRGGFSRTSTRRTQTDQGRDVAAEIGLTGIVTDAFTAGWPRVTIRDLMALGSQANVPVRWASNSFQVGDTVTWVKGKHLLKWGGEVLRLQTNDAVLVNNVRGTFNFLGRWTNDPFADFYLGLLNNTSRLIGRTPSYLRATHYGTFVQDDWRVLTRLTLNLGLRWDILKPPVEKYGRMSNFMPEYGQIIVADDRAMPELQALVEATNLKGRVALARDYGLPASLVYSRYRNVAPRFGFAWRQSRKFVVRGGYGIFFGAAISDPVRADLTSNYPFTINQTFQRNANNPGQLTFTTPFPAARVAIEGVNTSAGYELNAHSQYLQSWNLTLEREVQRDAVVELAYVGSKGTHLGRRYDINQPLRDPELRAPGTTAFPRPYTGINAIDYYSFGSNSVYWAGMVSYRKRLSGTLFYRVNYVYSKSIDDASQLSGAGDGGYGGAQDARNLRLERGRSDFDNGHAFTMNFVYELKLGRGRGRTGWQLAGTGRAYTGQPFTVRVSNVDLNLGDANRPDRIAKGWLEKRSPERWFDKAAFPVVPRGSFRFGTSGRNILDGPGMAAINAALSKRFRMGEGKTLQFRAEAFNVTNHTNFRLPENMVNAANAATLTQATQPRNMQLGLKLIF